MKSKLPLASLILLSFYSPVAAQQFPFALTTFTDDYVELSEAVSLTPDDNPDWDDPNPYYSFPIGFTFDLMGRSSDQVIIIDPGCQVIIGFNQDTVNAFSPYFADIRNASTTEVVSSILCSTEGAPGSQIFKIEWKNVGFYNEFEATKGFNSTSNYQVWLYEGSNTVEFRFGPNTITDGTLIHQEFGSALLFFIKDFVIETQTPVYSWNLRGPSTNPTVDNVDLYSMPALEDLMLGEPENGRVYRFESIPTGIAQVSEPGKFSLFPTLAHDYFATYWNGEHKLNMTVYDMAGNMLHQSSVGQGNNLVDISSWASGTYVVNLSNDTNSFTRKLLKE